ncbi:hypothetical protein Bca4012_045292 [Brassica carinata]
MHHEVDAYLNSKIGPMVEIASESVQFEQHDELLVAPTHRILDFGDQNFEVASFLLFHVVSDKILVIVLIWLVIPLPLSQRCSIYTMTLSTGLRVPHASGQLAPWILWQIWCARNQLVFEGKSITEEVCLTKAITSAKEWTSCQDKTPPPPRKTPPRTRPEQNCSVLNTDAAWRATNLTAGLGWTVKTREGTAEFTKPCRFVGSALIAEGLALREALSGCRDLGLRRIRCEADCAQLINALNSREAHPELYGILSDVFSISSSFEFISFTWIPRGSNKAADKLAKQCLVGEEVFMTDT